MMEWLLLTLCICHIMVDCPSYGWGGSAACDQNHTWLSAKKPWNARYYRRILRQKNDFRKGAGVLSICATFWDQYRAWLSAKKEKNARYNRRVLRKKGLSGRVGVLEHLWHLLGSKSHLNIDQKNRGECSFLWTCFEKNIDFLGAPFWI